MEAEIEIITATGEELLKPSEAIGGKERFSTRDFKGIRVLRKL